MAGETQGAGLVGEGQGVAGAAVAGEGQGPGVADEGWPSPGYRPAGRAWLLIRMTGLMLSVLVLGHLVAVHLLTDVARTTSSFVLRRWSTGLWVVWDGCMLTAALAHGAVGVYAVLRDHVRPGTRRTAAALALAVISLILAGLGWYTIIAVVQSALAPR